MEYEDAVGQIICRGDTVTFLNSSDPAADGTHYGVVIGTVRPWPKLLVRRVDGSKVTVNAGDVRVADRICMQPCMVVASSTDNGGQLGMVMSVATELDLARLPSPADGNAEPAVVARAVSPAELRRAGGEFSVGDFVVTTAGAGAAACSWLGCVLEVYLDVDVVFDDGAKCRAALWRSGKTTNKDGSNNTDFYPGQRVGVGSKNTGILKKSRWLKGYWKPNRGDGTVSRVETTSVLVYWWCSNTRARTNRWSLAAAPPNQQIPRDLTFLCAGNFFEEYTYWRVGDWCFFRGCARAASTTGVNSGLTTKRTRRAAALRDWRQLWRQRRPRQRNRPLLYDDGLEQRPLAVASTRTTVDVLWQDGTRQRGVPSTSLVVWYGETDNELFPGQHVARRMLMLGTMQPSKGEEDSGIVRGYNYKDKTVRVSWESDQEETLSAYDVVTSRSSTTHYGIFIRPQELPSTSSTSTTTNDLSWVGQHVYYEFDDEALYVYVKWGDGNTTKVLLGEMPVFVEPSMDDLLHEYGEWVDEDGAMNNVIDEQDDDNNKNNNGEDDNNSNSGSESGDSSGSDSDSDHDSGTSVMRMNWIGVIIVAAIRLSGNVFSQGWRYLVKSELTATESNNGDMLGGNGDIKIPSIAEAGINGDGCDGRSSTMEEKSEADATTGDDKSFPFPQFEILEQCPSDHHYIDNMEQGTGGGRKWTKRVQKEWKILENNNLPADTIYVQVFEDRMDLLRAVIVGASGTPYHDGLFFFDIQLPPSYPAEPPQVHYRSFGLHVNPNLYPSGTVCLSLINTFGGQHEAELWSPDASTILQVLVSIQGLVLTGQPYYNEPAWGQPGTVMGQRNELPYSESVFLQSLQTMLHLLRRPPVGFEEYIRDHFRRSGQHVIKACEAYRDGCIVGTLDKEGNPMEGSTDLQSTTGFRIALVNVLPRLVEAFASVDA